MPRLDHISFRLMIFNLKNILLQHAVDFSINFGLPVVRLKRLLPKAKLKKERHHLSSHTVPEIANGNDTEEASTSSKLDTQCHESQAGAVSCYVHSTSPDGSAVENKEKQDACQQTSNEPSVCPVLCPALKLKFSIVTTEEVLPAVTETCSDVIESETISELSPETVLSPSTEDPLGLNKDSLLSTKQTGEQSNDSHEAPAANTCRYIRVLPFESMVSPSVARAGRHLLSTPLRPPAFENVMMVAIPENSLSDLNIEATNSNAENGIKFTSY